MVNLRGFGPKKFVSPFRQGNIDTMLRARDETVRICSILKLNLLNTATEHVNNNDTVFVLQHNIF